MCYAIFWFLFPVCLSYIVVALGIEAAALIPSLSETTQLGAIFFWSG